MSLMSPYELKMKLDLADDRSRFVKEHSLPDKEHSLSNEMNVIVTDDGSMHFFDNKGNDITKSVKSIGKYEFNCCTSLKSIVIPSSVTSIGRGAFNNCKSLTNIVIPDSVTRIGDYAFSYCARLESIVIPDSAANIGKDAFAWCLSLKSISIPDSIKSIESWAFYGCESLTSIIFKGKTLEEVKSMDSFPWGVEDGSAFKAENKA